MAYVRDVDMGYKNIVQSMRKLNGMEISAGILRDAGNSKKGVPLVDIAFYNEYGTRHIPSRPFVRIASDDNRKKWEKMAGDCVGRVIDGGDVSDVGKTLGKEMVSDIRDVFGDTSRVVSNAPATIRKKGRDEPLVDTGAMKKSVNYRVE